MFSQLLLVYIFSSIFLYKQLLFTLCFRTHQPRNTSQVKLESIGIDFFTSKMTNRVGEEKIFTIILNGFLT